LHEDLTQQEHPMKCALLTLALIAATGSAAAQGLPPLFSNGGVAAPPGGGARLDTNVDLYRAQRRAATAPVNNDVVAALQSDVKIASAPAPRLTGAKGTVQDLLERNGYNVVHDLKKGPDGRWYGNAMRDTTLVTVSVDSAGRIATQ